MNPIVVKIKKKITFGVFFFLFTITIVVRTFGPQRVHTLLVPTEGSELQTEAELII